MWAGSGRSAAARGEQQASNAWLHACTTAQLVAQARSWRGGVRGRCAYWRGASATTQQLENLAVRIAKEGTSRSLRSVVLWSANMTLLTALKGLQLLPNGLIGTFAFTDFVHGAMRRDMVEKTKFGLNLDED